MEYRGLQRDTLFGPPLWRRKSLLREGPCPPARAVGPQPPPAPCPDPGPGEAAAGRRREAAGRLRERCGGDDSKPPGPLCPLPLPPPGRAIKSC